ncbi:transcription-repair coupling factor [Candidatus Macondimonas diazotrophica]|jgi:transcription-repair coupling factor (superfamily II helicase)|nr:transcription-repair coupling factor [Candidatus Macondimonas diazotrophica]
MISNHPSLDPTEHRVGPFPGSAGALWIAELARRRAGLRLIIASDARAGERLEAELNFYCAPDGPPILHFPDWETLPYDIFSPHQDILSQRIETLYRLPSLETALVVVPANTLLQRLPPISFVTGHSLILHAGERLDPHALRTRLEAAGYRSVSQVMEHGEFALRGSLMDLFPMGSAEPYRIDLLDDEIDSIRPFDPQTQRSREIIDQVRILPAREFPFDEEAIRQFRRRYREHFEGNPQSSLIYREVSDGHSPGGIEYYLPLFFDATATLLDYLPEHSQVILEPGAEDALLSVWDQIQNRYEQRRHDLERPLLPPGDLFLTPTELTDAWTRFDRIVMSDEQTPTDSTDPGNGALPPPVLRRNPHAKRPLDELNRFIETFPGRILIAAESPGQREALLDELRPFGLKPQRCAHWTEFQGGMMPLAITVAPLERGLLNNELAIISESQLSGERPRPRARKAVSRDPAAIIRDLTDLRPGAPVVHEEHGVGRYLGLQLIETGGTAAEFLVLEYAGEDKLYVPVANLHLVSRYTGADPEHAPLHRLGSDQWEKARRKAAERARDVAAELLEIQARRAAQRRTPVTFDVAAYHQFAAAFPFEETADQLQTIDAVIRDITGPNPMDRVVCGDVGFGKTEVAMRAAFIAVHGGRQVAILVPTTLLAEQHFRNFRDRFADWPVRVEGLSRLRSTKEQKQALAAMAEGQVDIVIGTHKLLSSEVHFKNLGLVIVDEEHRFGVRHKERLKQLRAEVDLLTLTATPIPRTLNMSLAGLRDLSIIATPPVERMAVQTFSNEWNDVLIQEACLREIKRGGQVFFVHNEIQDIQKIAERLGALVPGARVLAAHGQMPERELEQVMLDFYHRRANILVCTTIIESGIDIPTANTILIHRADRFGLAQLHQLRGRVGRSHHRAYCYLIVPPRKAMTADAIKRLDAFETLGALGSGFSLATQDLEIRGAGELLGEGQSGHIHEVGFGLYSELLERAVQAIKRGDIPSLESSQESIATVDLRLPTLLPESYVPDVDLRLILYKRIAGAQDHKALRALQVELIDRFGLLPTPSKNLFMLAELKLRITALGIHKLEAGPEKGRMVFSEQTTVDPALLLPLIQKSPNRFRLDGADTLRFTLPMTEPEERVKQVEALLDYFESSPTAGERQVI